MRSPIVQKIWRSLIFLLIKLFNFGCVQTAIALLKLKQKKLRISKILIILYIYYSRWTHTFPSPGNISIRTSILINISCVIQIFFGNSQFLYTRRDTSTCFICLFCQIFFGTINKVTFFSSWTLFPIFLSEWTNIIINIVKDCGQSCIQLLWLLITLGMAWASHKSEALIAAGLIQININFSKRFFCVKIKILPYVEIKHCLPALQIWFNSVQSFMLWLTYKHKIRLHV